MKKVRSVLCLIFAVCSLSTVSVASAAQIPEDVADPASSQFAVNRSITKNKVTWYQTEEKTAYRIWVENTTNQTMTVTVTSPSSSDYHKFYVSANSSKSVTENGAVAGVHTVTFSTPSGDLSGTVRVRVSDTTLM